MPHFGGRGQLTGYQSDGEKLVKKKAMILSQLALSWSGGVSHNKSALLQPLAYRLFVFAHTYMYMYAPTPALRLEQCERQNSCDVVHKML